MVKFATDAVVKKMVETVVKYAIKAVVKSWSEGVPDRDKLLLLARLLPRREITSKAIQCHSDL